MRGAANTELTPPHPHAPSTRRGVSQPPADSDRPVMQKGSPLGGAPATPTVKQVKRAFAAYIKYLNAHPDALSGCFKDEAGALDRAHEAARVAIRELRAAWQPLKPSTSAPELHIALTEMKTDIHPKFGFQSRWKGDDAIDETEACQLWSEYLRLHRALNLSASADVFQQGMPDVSALKHIRPIKEACADAIATWQAAQEPCVPKTPTAVTATHRAMGQEWDASQARNIEHAVHGGPG